MIGVLIDYNLEGQAMLLWGTLQAKDLLLYTPLRFVTFAEAGLDITSNDRVVWRFAQARGMVLLTGNRNMKGADSLELTLREELAPDSLPVLTIGDVNRMVRREYRERCAYQLIEILLDLDTFRGTSRLFIPTSA